MGDLLSKLASKAVYQSLDQSFHNFEHGQTIQQGDRFKKCKYFLSDSLSYMNCNENTTMQCNVCMYVIMYSASHILQNKSIICAQKKYFVYILIIYLNVFVLSSLPTGGTSLIN